MRFCHENLVLILSPLYLSTIEIKLEIQECQMLFVNDAVVSVKPSTTRSYSSFTIKKKAVAPTQIALLDHPV
jgi:hypothetical protein